MTEESGATITVRAKYNFAGKNNDEVRKINAKFIKIHAIG